MIIKCFRCGKEIDAPDEHNADYIIAPDTVVREPREVLIALKHNQATLAKQTRMGEVDKEGNRKYPDLTIADSEYDAVEISDFEASQAIGEDLVKVIAEVREKDIQKTGVICPECHKPTDFVIWGVHRRGNG
ncbi:hypothetical protein ES703_71936 [subsurface metagenome]